VVITLSDEQALTLLSLARSAIAGKLARIAGAREHTFTSSDRPVSPPQDPLLREPAAAFVTLTKGGRLRGCIGHLEAVAPLWQSVCDNAVGAAFHDSRFQPLAAEELPQVRLEISILSPPKPLPYRNPQELTTLLRPGVDGVILRRGWKQATFLPQVWQQLPEPELFLDQLCRKAGLPERSWRERDLDIFTYQVQCCGEEER
jgi:uncharacterized protein